MKHTTRKKMLLSSVAMLLVAMLALGSATFAWFTTNPNATEKGLTLRATAAKGLVIQTGSHAEVDDTFWGHTDFLKYVEDTDLTDGAAKTPGSSTEPISLAATSFDVTGKFTGAFTVDAENDDNYAPKAGAIVGNASNNDFYQEIIKCKLTGGESADDTDTVVVTDVALTNKNKNLSNCIRVALQYTYNNTTTNLGVYAPAARSNKYLTKVGVYEDSLMPKNTTDEQSNPVVKTHDFPIITSISNMDAGTVDTTGTGYFTVTVYLDGEDSECYTDNIQLADLLSDLIINLKLKSAK